MNTNIYRISRMSNRSVGMLAIRMIESAYASALTEVIESKQFETLVGISNDFTDANNRIDTSSLSKEILETEILRAETFEDMLIFLVGQTKSRDLIIQNAANGLYSKLSVYNRNKLSGKKGDLSFEFSQIVSKLNEADSKTAIATLKMDELVSDFEESHTTYESKHKLRSDLKKAINSPTSIRPRLNKAIGSYIKEVEIMYNRTGNVAWGNLLQDLENRVNEITISKRTTPPGDEKEDSKTDTNETVA